MSLIDEIVEACALDEATTRASLRRALDQAGVHTEQPGVAEVRRALPGLKRILSESMHATDAYDVVERAEILLQNKHEMPEQPPSLSALTQRLREINAKLSGRDFAGEIASTEAALKKRSFIPPSR